MRGASRRLAEGRTVTWFASTSGDPDDDALVPMQHLDLVGHRHLLGQLPVHPDH